jgi:hypothetical protein
MKWKNTIISIQTLDGMPKHNYFLFTCCQEIKPQNPPITNYHGNIGVGETG